MPGGACSACRRALRLCESRVECIARRPLCNLWLVRKGDAGERAITIGGSRCYVDAHYYTRSFCYREKKSGMSKM